MPVIISVAVSRTKVETLVIQELSTTFISITTYETVLANNRTYHMYLANSTVKTNATKRSNHSEKIDLDF